MKPSGIVHIFAALHAAVTIACFEAGIGDELFLTILTMAMIILVCLKKNLNLEFTAGIVIVINVTGYLLGTAGANLIGMFFSTDWVVHACSTAFTTELLGWGTILVGNILSRLHHLSFQALHHRFQRHEHHLGRRTVQEHDQAAVQHPCLHHPALP